MKNELLSRSVAHWLGLQCRLALLTGLIFASLSVATAGPIIASNGAALTAESCLVSNSVIDPGETVTVELSLRNTGSSDTTNLTATLLASGGVSSPSGAQTYGVLVAGGAPVSRPFTFTASGTCGATVTATLQLQDDPNNLGTVSFNLQLGTNVLILAENFDGVTPTNLPAGWTSTNAVGAGVVWTTTTAVRDTLPNSVFAPDPAIASDNRLTSPNILVSSESAQLTFRHNYNTESGFDGGRLEISMGGGAFTGITNAGGSFVTGGYNSSIQFGSVPAWSGNSGGFILTKVNLPASATGQNIQLRWRFTSDSSGTGAGWYVDSIALSDYRCCAATNGADVLLVMSDAPDPVLVASNLTYTLRATNRGPVTATAVMLTNTLPGGVSMVTNSASQGSCTNVGGVIACNLGSLASNASASVTITVKPTAPGTLTNTASITANEPDSNPLNNTASAVTTVNLPALSIDDVTVTEGNSGTGNAVFHVTLSPASASTVTVSYATDDDDAVAPADYFSTNGILTFTPGQTSKTITVQVRGDTLSEANETFVVDLFNPTNAALTVTEGTGTITDNDVFPLLSINNVSVVEGNSGTTNAVFTVNLSPASGQAVLVDFATTNGTAVVGSDYVATSDTLVFDPGQTSQTISVTILSDTFNEANETFLVNLLNPMAATFNDSQGVGTIVNDDLLPNVDVVGAAVTVESCSATNGAVDPGETVTVNFSMKNVGTGTARTTNLVATLQATGGVLSPGAPQNYGALTVGGAAVARPFTFTANGNCGGGIVATFQLQDGPNNLGVVTNLMLLGKPTVTFTQSFDGVTAPNLPAGWSASLTGTGTVWSTTAALRDTLPNSAFAPDPDGTSDNRLTSPPIPIVTASAQLTFKHDFTTEEFFDGGVLEISVGGGPFTNILAAGGSFISGGYNGAFNNDSSRPAWTGISGGFLTTTAMLPASAAGQNIQLRWRFLSDIFGSSVGWYVDTISVTDGTACCGNVGAPSLTATLSGTNVLVSWPANAAGYSLQSRADLSSNTWSYVSNPPVIVNDRYLVTEPVTNLSRFYRLIK